MAEHLPRLPFELDPLIAEAKRRMRRRRFLAFGALVLVVVVVAAVVATWSESPPSSSPATAGPSVHSAGRPQAPVDSVASSGGVTSVVTEVGRDRHELWLSATGGRTWFKATAPQRVIDNRPSPYFVDRRHGWLSDFGYSPRWQLYRTTDGGRTWQRATPPGCAPCDQGSFNLFDAEHGSVFAGTFLSTTLFSTRDGGVTWKRVWSTRTAPGGGLFADPQHGISGDYSGSMPYDTGVFRLSRTSDGGRTWTPVMLGGKRPYPGVVGGMTSIGGTFVIPAWLDGRNLVYTSSDGGASWRAHSVPAQAWVVGTGQDAKVFPALFSAPSPTTWVTTDLLRRHLFVTTDAGKRWHETRLPLSFKFAVTIDFTSAHVGWAVPTSQELLRTTDGGRHWKQVTRPHRRTAHARG